jgi:hypothetical protein
MIVLHHSSCIQKQHATKHMTATKDKIILSFVIVHIYKLRQAEMSKHFHTNTLFFESPSLSLIIPEDTFLIPLIIPYPYLPGGTPAA